MELEQIIREVAPVSDEGIEALKSILRPMTVKAGTLLIEEGKIARELYLIQSGYLRNFALDDGKEHTRWFATEGDVVASMFSYAHGLPAMASVEALTPVNMYVARHSDIKQLISESAEWAHWVAVYLIEGLYILERRYTYLGQGDAMAKYRSLQRMRSFDMLNKIPLQYVASYLGVTPQTLSRVRRKLASKEEEDNVKG